MTVSANLQNLKPCCNGHPAEGMLYVACLIEMGRMLSNVNLSYDSLFLLNHKMILVKILIYGPGVEETYVICSRCGYTSPPTQLYRQLFQQNN